MKRKVTIHKDARTVYLPKEVVDEGFTGEADAYADAFTFTIVRPQTSLSRIKESLEIVLADINMRLKAEREGIEEVAR